MPFLQIECKICKQILTISFGIYTEQFKNNFMCYNCYTKQQINQKAKTEFKIELLKPDDIEKAEKNKFCDGDTCY